MDPARLTRLIDRVAESASAPKVIRAYHGSPYDFDRFDASKIGTGEGAQSFGHGLYFAGDEGVARSYRNNLSPKGRDVAVDGQSLLDLYNALPEGPAFGKPRSAQGVAYRSVLNVAGDTDDPYTALGLAIQDADNSLTLDRRGEYRGSLADVLEELHKLNDRKLEMGPHPGRMYEVEIGHPEEAMLDLDAAVMSQPAAIQSALGEFGEAPKWFSMGQEGWSGKNAYTRMANVMASKNPRIVGGYHVTHDMPAASEALLRSGVPGVRYLDGGSRAAGQGTRNYVVFPGAEDSIRILRKFAVPGAVGVGAASMGGDGDQ